MRGVKRASPHFETFAALTKDSSSTVYYLGLQLCMAFINVHAFSVDANYRVGHNMPNVDIK